MAVKILVLLEIYWLTSNLFREI